MEFFESIREKWIASKIAEGQWRSINRHRVEAFGKFERDCTDDDGQYDWKKAEKLKTAWDHQHGYQNRP